MKRPLKIEHSFLRAVISSSLVQAVLEILEFSETSQVLPCMKISNKSPTFLKDSLLSSVILPLQSVAARKFKGALPNFKGSWNACTMEQRETQSHKFYCMRQLLIMSNMKTWKSMHKLCPLSPVPVHSL